MLLIPISKGSNIDLLIILEQDNIDRIQEYDPAEVIWSQLPPAMNRRTSRHYCGDVRHGPGSEEDPGTRTSGRGGGDS